MITVTQQPQMEEYHLPGLQNKEVKIKGLTSFPINCSPVLLVEVLVGAGHPLVSGQVLYVALSFDWS